jgi:hypothetical protein
MRRTLILAMAAIFALSATAQARTKLVALPDREAVTIRFDNPAATLVEEERVLAERTWLIFPGGVSRSTPIPSACRS